MFHLYCILLAHIRAGSPAFECNCHVLCDNKIYSFIHDDVCMDVGVSGRLHCALGQSEVGQPSAGQSAAVRLRLLLCSPPSDERQPRSKEPRSQDRLVADAASAAVRRHKWRWKYRQSGGCVVDYGFRLFRDSLLSKRRVTVTVEIRIQIHKKKSKVHLFYSAPESWPESWSMVCRT